MAKLKYKDNDTWVEWSDPDKADKATTLAGYGITDAYTKTQTDNLLNDKENTANKVISISAQSTDDQYPTAKCVYDLIGNIETLLQGV